MCSSIGAVNFLAFSYFAVSLTAHVEHFASVAVSAQHMIFRLLWELTRFVNLTYKDM